MKIGTFFGYKCSRCNIKVQITISTSDIPRCSNCGQIMEPDPSQEPIACNVYCPNCDASYGIVDSEKCPNCGKKFGTS